MGTNTKHSCTSNSPSCFDCPVLGTGAWRELNTDGLAQLNRFKSKRTLKKGDFLFHQGDPSVGVWCIIGGHISVQTVDMHGKSILVRIANSGQTVGARSFFAFEPHSGSARALAKTEVCFIHRDLLNDLISKHPKVALRFLETVAVNLRVAHETILRGATMNLHDRLGYLLLQFHEQFGSASNDDRSTFDLPLTRRDMAQLLGTCPESLSRAIRKLQESGMVEFMHRSINIESLTELRTRVDPSFFD